RPRSRRWSPGCSSSTSRPSRPTRPTRWRWRSATSGGVAPAVGWPRPWLPMVRGRVRRRWSIPSAGRGGHDRGRAGWGGGGQAGMEVGGGGRAVACAPNPRAGLRVGAEAGLATSLVVREDSLTLYGFADDDARQLFELLQTASGVGPRLAQAVLAVHSPGTV